jgi:hypothetical protein
MGPLMADALLRGEMTAHACPIVGAAGRDGHVPALPATCRLREPVRVAAGDEIARLCMNERRWPTYVLHRHWRRQT